MSKVPFRRYGKPLKLSDYVGSGGATGYRPVCLSDLAILLSCFKTTNFGHNACTEEIKNYQTCYMNAYNSASAKAAFRIAKAEKLKNLLKEYPIL